MRRHELGRLTPKFGRVRSSDKRSTSVDCGSLAHWANEPETESGLRVRNAQRPVAAQIRLAVGTRCARRTRYAETYTISHLILSSIR